jgi:hypothetical protein
MQKVPKGAMLFSLQRIALLISSIAFIMPMGGIFYTGRVELKPN